MATKVGISLRGPQAGMDADASLETLSKLLKVIAELERTEGQKNSKSKVSRWTFQELRLGSVNATLEPLELAPESSYTTLERVLEQMVGGFQAAEKTAELPPRWTPRAARLGADAVRRLGASPDVGMELLLYGDTVLRVDVTQRAHQNLRAAVVERYTSFGSRRGHLNSLFDTDKGTIKGVLKSEVGNERIPLVCPESLREDLRGAWGEDRVEVTGNIIENARGQVMRIMVDELEILPTEPSLTAEELKGGFWPDMTGGLSAREHLAVIRGEA
ncbi:hypothetical protein [Streptomyces liangshanensis]|uniref:hypothetical protein n=1 Tax=Streptomyces liangshanensis TaxID=2717324 RepID=UPI0036D874FB